VGEDDVTGAEQAIVVPEANGVAGQTVAVALPANAQSGPGEAASLSAVSCSPSGTCVAVGEYLDTSGVTDALVVPISLGVAGTGVEVTPPGASGESFLRAVSCPATGACVAVGTYGIDANAYQAGVVVAVSAGAPGAPTEVTLPSNAATSTPSVSVNSVSCWAGGSCFAAGEYLAAGGAVYPLVIPVAGGIAGTGIETTLPADAYAGTIAQQSALTSVACQAMASCVAVGYYVDTSGGSRPLVVPIGGAGPAAAGEVTLPSNAAAATLDDGLNGVACPPSGPCAAVGYYVDTDGSDEALAVPVSGGAVATGLQASLPANAAASSTTDQDASLNAVSCPVSGSCLAVGDFSDASYYQQGMAVPIASGATGAASETTLPVGESANPDASLDAVTCVASASCVALGQYSGSTGQTEAFESSLQTPLTISTPSLPLTRAGVRYDTALTATGAWGSYGWSVSSGRLPAGMSLNAQTGVISGKRKNPRTYRFTVRVSGTGSPAQTVSRALSLAPEPVITLSLSRAGLKLSGRDVSIRVRCSIAACRGSVEVVYPHEVTLKNHKRKRELTVIARASYSLSKRHARTVKMEITKAGLRFLDRTRRHRLSVVVEATVKTGASVSKRTKVYAVVAKVKAKRKTKRPRRGAEG
jgi:hypothetical protein